VTRPKNDGTRISYGTNPSFIQSTLASYGSESNCSDGINNDGDSYTDCGDADCIGEPTCWGRETQSCYFKSAKVEALDASGAVLASDTESLCEFGLP
jgi:hypothetical protein